MAQEEMKLEDILKARGIDDAKMDEMLDYEIPPMKESTAKLMETYYTLKVSADMEAPYWYNRVWWENDGEITEVRRAKAVAASLAHMTPTIQPGEKIVMNKCRYIRGAFPFPWICASFFNAQAEALMNEVEAPVEESTADAITQMGAGGNVTENYGEIMSLGKKFGIRKELVPVLVKVSRPWKGISVEELSDHYMKKLSCYDQYREIMDSVICMLDSYTVPQGREAMNYYLPLEYGFDRLMEMCDEKMEELLGEAGTDGQTGMSRGYYYVAMKEIVKGLSTWCENHAKRAAYLATIEPDKELKANYEQVAEMMMNVAHKKPASFQEALQMTLCCHLGVCNEDPMSGMSPGRLGQVLELFYEKDVDEGVCTDEDIIELLEQYRIKITCIECFASAGVTGGVLSGNTFNSLSLGGQSYEGLSGATRLEYLILEAGMRNKTPQPTLSMLYDEKLPEDFLMKAATCCKLGMGYPAWMSNQGGINFMMRNYGREGITIEEARAWCPGGCLESAPGVFQELHYNGKSMMIPGGASPTCGSGVHFLAMPKILELVLTNGFDNRTGKQVLPRHDKELNTYEDVLTQWEDYMYLVTDVVNKANNLQMDIWRKQNMPVVASLLKANCFKTGRHLGTMGARFNATINVESCGTVNLINSLVSLKKNVFEDKKYTLEEMTDAMLNNFGFKTAYETGVFSPDFRENTENAKKYEAIFADCINAPKYGNADVYADSVLVHYERWFYDFCQKFYSYYGFPLYLCQISVSTHGPQGFVTLARADGTLAGTTYADASMSAAPATDKNGVYAIFESATCYDHSLHQNSQMNLKIHPTAVKGLNGTRKLLDLIRAYMHKGGFHIQFNIIGSEVLKKAQKKPEDYRDLMVRVAGFTQYWCEIGKPIQDEVIYRTEYESV